MSEEIICNLHPNYICINKCRRNSSGWEKFYEFNKKELPNSSDKIMRVIKDLGYEDNKDLSKTAIKVMNDFLSTKHKLMVQLPPVEIVKVYPEKPRIIFRGDSVCMTFQIKRKGFTEYDREFSINFIHSKDSDGFELIYMHQHMLYESVDGIVTEI